MTQPPVLVPQAGPGVAAGRTRGDHGVPCMALRERELGAQKAAWWGRAVGIEAGVQKRVQKCVHALTSVHMDITSL